MKCFSDDQIKKNEMGRAYSMCGGDESSGVQTSGKASTWKTQT